MRIVRTTARRAPLRLNGSSVSEACPWTTGRTGSASQQSSAGVDWFNSPLGRAHTLVRIGGAYWLRVRELLKHSVVGPARLHPQIDSSNPAAISATMKTICSSVRSSSGVAGSPAIVRRWRAARAFAGNRAINSTARQTAAALAVARPQGGGIAVTVPRPSCLPLLSQPGDAIPWSPSEPGAGLLASLVANGQRS